ncbi:hypothetical protein [Affinibrenneria salicis]|nr:hypothetical protein [Affinibrenneria salicis]
MKMASGLITASDKARRDRKTESPRQNNDSDKTSGARPAQKI